ncbi:hypothetical protein [Variovorax boronicumulans]|uniref:hypothetical protein n=1 Tax=Variovorax boronicumulans TaxID=436515 RepID=UPI003395E8C6
MTVDTPFGLVLVCLAVGVLGAGVGAWALSHAIRGQLCAQRQAFEQAREQAQRDLQQALLCVPQWIQQGLRVELELLGRQQAERDKAGFGALQRWQLEQDDRRRAEWQALLSGPLVSRPDAVPPPPLPVAAPAPRIAPVASVLRTERDDAAQHPVSVYTLEAPKIPQRELSDEEIDALPPDLPAMTRLRGKKRQGPSKPVLQQI